MQRLFKYFKPYTFLLLAAVALLFVQANADLALPDYLSRIVNVGIQAGGIEDSIPRAIRQQQMDKVTIFLDAEDAARVLGDYRLVEQGGGNEPDLVNSYPALQDEPVYVLSDIDQAEMDWLNPRMAKAMLAVYGIQQLAADSSNAASLGLQLPAGFDLSKLPPGTDLFSLIRQMPASSLAQITSAIDQRFEGMPASALDQAAAAAIKAENTALGTDAAKLSSSYILRIGGLMLLLTLLGAVCTVAVGYLSSRVASGLARDLRKHIFTRVESFSHTEFDRFSTASLITRSTNDITQIQMTVLMMVRMVFYAPIIGVGGIIRAVSKDSSMWWIIALAVGILIALILVVYRVAVPKFKIIQKLIDRLNLVTRENLSGMMVIRAFNRQDFELERFDKANQDLTATSLFINRVMVVMMPVMMFVMNAVSLLIIWVGAKQVAAANMQVGDMMAFMQYAMQILFSFLMLSFMFIILPRAQVSADRIADVLETEPAVQDPTSPVSLPGDGRGKLEFDHVSFRYPGAEEDVLHDITFTTLPGQTTAFIGPTGSGKSTIVNLIPRFYDVSEGAIRVDGVDIRNITQKDLRARIGLVPQKNALFSGTIESNLRFGAENAPDETVQEAAEIAQAAEFIDSKEEKWEAPVSQGGSNLSGGQKQRLSIARALAKQAPINILDDSFSALDFKTDSALRRALLEHAREINLMIITQRVAAVKSADQIIVMDEGRIVGKGSHKELMQTCETYKEIAVSQLSMGELS